MENSIKPAFTLAEILITLGIIGVIAALTLPMLIANYQKQVTVNKLQKSYSILNQAFKQSELDNGSSEFWQETFEIGIQEYFERYWKPYFANITLCKIYNECGYNLIQPFSGLNNWKSALAITSDRIKLKTSDGTLFLFTDSTVNSEGERIPLFDVYIDINGGKEPNIFGKDVFIFRRVAGKGIVPACNNLTQREVESSCSRNGQGSCCAAKIIRDGWKINNDYPWR